MKSVLVRLAFGLVGAGTIAPAVFAAGDKKPETLQGVIQKVDGKAHSFVLGGPNESQTNFKVLVANEGNREAAHILLDGKRSTFEDAIQAKRQAAVTFLQVGDERWVWKVDVKTTK